MDNQSGQIRHEISFISDGAKDDNQGQGFQGPADEAHLNGRCEGEAGEHVEGALMW